MPIRSCASCREKAEKDELIRFVLLPLKSEEVSAAVEPTASVLQESADGVLGVGVGLFGDVAHRISGRGAYCHLSLECLRSEKLLPSLLYSLRREGGGRQKVKGRRTSTGVATRSSDEMLLALLEQMLLSSGHDRSSGYDRPTQARFGQLRILRQDLLKIMESRPRETDLRNRSVSLRSGQGRGRVRF